MDLELKGKRALVTGSTAGIGFAIAASLAKEGARVVVTGRTEAGVDKAVAKVKADTGGEVVGFAGDLGGSAACEALIRSHPEI
ncbi:MAG TPA: SDR family NAD(P)-dependent oxidoreductase, partial [Roseiarcus sp.]|nr:SDR family NAD(P)-dependent oxidoreductase [Roseiarcus sp.]